MFGFSTRAEFIGGHPSMLSPPRQQDGRDSFVAANEKIAEALEHGRSHFEWLHRRTDGTEFPAEILLSAFDYDGKRVLQATARDITERKRIELELQRLNVDLEGRIDARTQEITAALSRLEDSRHKLQAIVDTALDAVVRIDANGAIIGWNAQAEAIFGWPVEQILGRRLEETIVPEQHRAAHCGGMTRYMATGISTVIDKRIEICAVRRDGTEIPIELAITRVALEDPKEFEFCAFIRDITQRRQAEAEFRNSLEKQRELNTLKSRFITMASHEFRTPLATILSSTELLQNYLERLPQSERNDLFHSISLAVRRMSSMLEDILIIGKDDAERSTFNPSMVDLEKLFSALVKEVLVGQPDVMHETRHSIDVMFCCTEPRGVFDEQLLRHIFGNLLSNAVKYSSANDPVVCSMECNTGEFIFTITDSGIGIPDEDLPRLFGNFHRASNVGNIPGTGLGLAIVKRSVDLHSGTITVQSSIGKGSTFTVRLPRQSPDLA
jgi:PAS domain S-box-containing protein